MAEQTLSGFGGLLRRLRAEAGLTQEELAEAARLSPRSVSDLERGINRTARKETARLLADALGLTGPARAQFEAAARGRVSGVGVPSGLRALPRDVSGFTGRQAELEELAGAAAVSGGVVSICAIGGMAGIGKTAIAVHAAHQLAGWFPDGQIFMPLYGHTPGHRPAEPADVLATVLLLIGLTAAQIPPGLEARAGVWRDRAAGRRFLLVLDDAVGSEQVRPLLPGTPGCLVLITSRRHLLGLEEAIAISLDALPPDDAAALFTALAARPGLEPGDGAVRQITALCGFLPLAVGLLARQLHHHPAWTPDELAAGLAAARDRLPLLDAGELSVAAAFDLSYAELTAGQQRLFRRLGLHPGPDIDAYAAAALDGSGLAAARQALGALYDHYLLTEPAAGRYRFHDLIREHARALAARDDKPADRNQAVGQLLAYYQHAAAAADRRLSRYTRCAAHPPSLPRAAGPDPVIAAVTADPAVAVPDLADSTRALSWARAERANLIACLDQAAAAGHHAQAAGLTAGLAALLRHDGPWAEAVTRHAAAVHAARRVGDRHTEAGALLDLGIVQHETGNYRDAGEALEGALGIYRDIGDRLGRANALHELGVIAERTGRYPDAEGALEEALGIYRDLGDRLGQADTLVWLGYMRGRAGGYRAGAGALEEALGLFRDLGDRLGQARALIRLGDARRMSSDYQGAAGALEMALDISQDLGDRLGQTRALMRLGQVRLDVADYPGAAGALEMALDIARDLGSRLDEGNALAALGEARRLTGDYPGAAEALQAALDIHRDLGGLHSQAADLTSLGAVWRVTGDYQAAGRALRAAEDLDRSLGDREGLAWLLYETGTLHRLQGDVRQARDCHQQALQLARDIGSPWNEAAALAGLGRCAQALGRTTDALDNLRRALKIFQGIGAAEARQVSAELDALTQVPGRPHPDDPGQ